MAFEPDMDTVIRIGWTVTAIAFLVTVVSILGELLDWWGFLGEVGATAGATITVLVGLATLLTGAGRRQVGGVQAAVEANGTKLGKLDKLDSMDTKLDKLAKLDDLDRVQFELDTQTGCARSPGGPARRDPGSALSSETRLVPLTGPEGCVRRWPALS